jgi:hypothetical protein
MKSLFKITGKEVREGFLASTHHLRVRAQFTRPFLGGQPATKEGIEMFVKYQAGITDPKEQQEMVTRLLAEEVSTTPPEGEIETTMVGTVNVLRKDTNGVWIGDWMVKAMIKQTTSRLGLWMREKGLKGDMSESGRVFASGISALDEKGLHKIYLRDEAGTGPCKTDYTTQYGKIHTAQGDKSIVNNAEYAKEGSTFEFVYCFLGDRLSTEDTRQMVNFIGNTALGSARSLEYGKFEIIEAEYLEPEVAIRKSKGEVKAEGKSKKAAAGK